MIPLVGFEGELAEMRELVVRIGERHGLRAGEDYLVGTMIELPRACFVADRLADRGRLLLLRHQRPHADRARLLARRRRGRLRPGLPRAPDPRSLAVRVDRHRRRRRARRAGRGARPQAATRSVELGVCGEHGGDPDSIAFFHRAGLDYVSCSPYRLPIARVAAAQAALAEPMTRRRGGTPAVARRRTTDGRFGGRAYGADMTRKPPPHILIAGGGVAAVEAVAALRALAGPLPRITLLAPEAELTRAPRRSRHRSASVCPDALPFEAIQRHAHFDLYRGTLAARRARRAGRHRRPRRADPLRHPPGRRRCAAAARRCRARSPSPARPTRPRSPPRSSETSRLAFVLPVGLRLGAAGLRAGDHGGHGVARPRSEPEITVVTPEPAPLWVFGPDASAAVAELLAERGIALRTGARAVAVRPGELELAEGPPSCSPTG